MTDRAVDLGCQLGTSGEPPWAELDDGIRETVRWLWGHGFHTTDSGDGLRLGAKAEMEGVLDVPHVFMVCAPDEMIEQAERLDALVDGIHQGEVQATFYPAAGISTIELYGIDDAALTASLEDAT